MIIKQYIAFFYSNSKAETIIHEKDIHDLFVSFYIVILFQTYKYLYQKVQVGLLIQFQIIILIFQSIIPQLLYQITNSYIKLPKEQDHPKKVGVKFRTQDDNESFK